MKTRTLLAAGTAGVGLIAATLAAAPTASAADVNRPPVQVVSGGNTGLNLAVGVTRDKAGRLYAASYSNNAIRIFGPNANGNATPLRSIQGGATQLSAPADVAVDNAGYLYVTNEGT
ncbi:UNVERIFIED_CONTAM: hypothetical protein LK11_05115, partial [Mumia flava]